MMPLFIAIVLAQLADWITSLVLFEWLSGYELNPIMAGVVSDPSLFFLVKMAGAALMILLIVLFRIERKHRAWLWIIPLFAFAPAINNLFQIAASLT